METIFRSAVSHIKAKESIKRKTEEYLMENLSSTGPAPDLVRTRNPLMKRVIVAACTFVFICTASIGAYAYYKTPTSFLSLDINPSVELGVNTFGKVVSATAYNSDGKTILDGQNVFGSDVKDAINTLVKSAAQKGFVAKDGSTVIAVTSETDNSETAAELQDAAEQGAASAVESQGDTASVLKENVALERRDEARKLGITPGKLNLIGKLQALDPAITVDEYKDAKVTDIMKKFVELKKATLPNQDKDNSSSAESISGASSSESGKTAATQPGNGIASNNESPKSGSADSTSSSAGSQSGSNAGINASNNDGKSDNAANNNKGADGNANYGQTVAKSHKK